MRIEHPLVGDGSVDTVISNCVLNLVANESKPRLFKEIYRVLSKHGRAVISDIVSDEEVPKHLQNDPDLWSGCISGAMREEEFLNAFVEAGFIGVTLLERSEEPWQTVEGIEFRSVTVSAYRGKDGPCLDQKHAVIYRGPFSFAKDDDGHIFARGVRTAVCAKTFRLLAREPYKSHFELVEPKVHVPLEVAPEFPCGDEPLVRHPRESKGEGYALTTTPSSAKCC